MSLMSAVPNAGWMEVRIQQFDLHFRIVRIIFFSFVRKGPCAASLARILFKFRNYSPRGPKCQVHSFPIEAYTRRGPLKVIV